MFYISDGTYSYILYNKKLSEINKAHTSIITDNNQLKSVYTEIFDANNSGEVLGILPYTITSVSNDTEYQGEIVSNTLVFKHHGLKKLNSVEFHITYTDITDCKCKIHYRYNGDESFATTDWLSLNDRGFVYPEIVAKDFRIDLKIPDYRNANIYKIFVDIEYIDKRNKRGYEGGKLWRD